MDSIKMVGKTINLKERVKDYAPYLLNRNFRCFIKTVIRFFEEKKYVVSPDALSVQFLFTEDDLLNNNIMLDDYFFEDLIEFYLNGFMNIYIEERIFIGTEEVKSSAYNLASTVACDSSIGFIEVEAQYIHFKFKTLKDLIFQLDEIYELEHVFFEKKLLISLDEFRARQLHDDW
jgi:hypothetical protein